MSTVTRFGSSALLVRSAHPHADAARLSGMSGVASLVPGAGSVLVHLDGSVPADVVTTLAQARMGDEAATGGVRGSLHVLPVRYDGEDLHEVADRCGLSVEEVVARHTGAVYTVDFVGFAPGFPYLSGLDPVLHLPRRDVPRTRVPAGAVGIAGAQGCVYPSSSPGGWNLLGVSEAVLFDPAREVPSLLAAGDRVRFEVAR